MRYCDEQPRSAQRVERMYLGRFSDQATPGLELHLGNTENKTVCLYMYLRGCVVVFATRLRLVASGSRQLGTGH